MRRGFTRQRAQAERPVAVQPGTGLPVLQQHRFEQHCLRFVPGLLPLFFREQRILYSGREQIGSIIEVISHVIVEPQSAIQQRRRLRL
ncbi:hypothetical protein D3C76_1602750 [compost metagenome]